MKLRLKNSAWKHILRFLLFNLYGKQHDYIMLRYSCGFLNKDEEIKKFIEAFLEYCNLLGVWVFRITYEWPYKILS